MTTPVRVCALAAAALVALAGAASAQPVTDASGHWEGAVSAPSGRVIAIEVDLAKEPGAQLSGTINMPGDNIAGLPLLNASVEGRAITFYARHDQTFAGTFSDDRAAITGEFTMLGATAPFTLRRTGGPRVVPPVKSPAIGKELEGTWRASLNANGIPIEVVLTLTNDADGSSRGRLVSVNEGGLVLPIAVAQKSTSVTLQSLAVPSSFSGELNRDATELAGTWTQGSAALPVTFRRER
jgi:hypothetical protein